jgi:2-phospho-L-lactate guanylyltransferase
MCVPTTAGFVFAYGPGSFDAHVAEAERLGLAITIVDDDSLAWDVDDPADLPVDWLEQAALTAEDS